VDRTADATAEEIQAWLQLVRDHVPARLRRALGQALLRQGLASFVLDLAIPFLHAVGEAWAQGRLAVFEEHLASDVLDTTLRSALAATPEPGTSSVPRVLLSTLQGETHGLGLLMADALFSVEGCACMNLGCQTPSQDLAAATAAYRADIVVLSSSTAANPVKLAEALAELRALLPAPVELWTGLPHAGLLRRGVPGVRLFDRLDSIASQVQRWRADQ
jgi:methanogenic corrinoid protein MtbC1